MKKFLPHITLIVTISVVLLLLILGTTHVIHRNVVLPVLFPVVILMLGLTVYIYKGAENYEDRDR